MLDFKIKQCIALLIVSLATNRLKTLTMLFSIVLLLRRCGIEAKLAIRLIVCTTTHLRQQMQYYLPFRNFRETIPKGLQLSCGVYGSTTIYSYAKMSHVLPQHTLTTFTSSASSVVFSPTIQNNEVTSVIPVTHVCPIPVGGSLGSLLFA
ncbi:uncharacterized protein [Medicago truncatula]|uniref:uncharacterized protein n=1 Tax=Medicago truncatula TaxID=3880 RepID=UPI000D2F14F7|nr:uncharacterized protein LOC112416307 [Medicago truncatula]